MKLTVLMILISSYLGIEPCNIIEKTNVYYLNTFVDNVEVSILINDIDQIELNETNSDKFICSLLSVGYYTVNKEYTFIPQLEHCKINSLSAKELRNLKDNQSLLYFELADKSHVTMAVTEIDAEFWQYESNNKWVQSTLGIPSNSELCPMLKHSLAFKSIKNVELVPKDKLNKIIKLSGK
ncbi:hypothetical protein [Fulvivirga lutea]|uniref:Uncharacterized protein n=1 Tax=Fulvivirga lutea TaxID=2810512 RepID=A0A975A099_9BACT|nr:hypothetical protein [Fulvivirga lutea]QSE96581.1 hypothetical protein JR347_13360 [Fulvivirga lutea]